MEESRKHRTLLSHKYTKVYYIYKEYTLLKGLLGLLVMFTQRLRIAILGVLAIFA